MKKEWTAERIVDPNTPGADTHPWLVTNGVVCCPAESEAVALERAGTFNALEAADDIWEYVDEPKRGMDKPDHNGSTLRDWLAGMAMSGGYRRIRSKWVTLNR